MTYPQAIVIGVALIAAAIIFTNIAPPVEAQQRGRWQMQTTSVPATAWRINTLTGVMQICFGVPVAYAGLVPGGEKKPGCTTVPNP